jgi:hypothetical protein
MAEKPVFLSGDPGRYCREVETYLCRKNEGHLIRIVGPAFEQVCSWAERGVPLKIAFRGIDRYCDRYYAKAGRRRPVRIEFCEADILDTFDEWRRAVGVASADAASGKAADESARPRAPLATHIERALVRLRELYTKDVRSTIFRSQIDSTLRELEAFVASARAVRGESRARMVERLAALDADLLASAVNEVTPQRSADLVKEAEAELAPFGGRLSAEARERALRGAFHRLVREALSVPTLTYE